jgi:hypothetical protein
MDEFMEEEIRQEVVSNN